VQGFGIQDTEELARRGGNQSGLKETEICNEAEVGRKLLRRRASFAPSHLNSSSFSFTRSVFGFPFLFYNSSLFSIIERVPWRFPWLAFYVLGGIEKPHANKICLLFSVLCPMTRLPPSAFPFLFSVSVFYSLGSCGFYISIESFVCLKVFSVFSLCVLPKFIEHL